MGFRHLDYEYGAAAVWADGGYQLTVTAKPAMAGSFNTSAAEMVTGETIRLYAYANANWTFVKWTDDKGDVVSRQMDFVYTMPDRNVTLTAEYEYNPANPANPSKNYWNKELGEVIVDDFTAGSLGSAVSSAISGSNSSEVQMITVAGVINNNDFGIINTYSNCTLLDLSRVTGVTQVPSYAFDYTKLESVYLPATIERIGYRAFYNCQQLSSLIVYAMTPPALENQVFTGVPDGLVVYVPAAAIAQYQEADVWKNFTILPIQEDIRSITISLPEGASAADYAKMWLELTNTRSGQRMHYVMTDRRQYTFANIIRNTSWNVMLRNERGDVFGQIDDVEVKDEDVSVVFSTLSKPQIVSLDVQTPDGQNVTAQTQITWTDAQGKYVAQGALLTGLPVGYQANYRVALSQELAMQYDTPQADEYVLKDGGNNIVCQLQSIKQIQMTGKVKDAATGLLLGGATVSASQTFGGKYSKTLNTKTDNNGVFTLTIADVPTSVAIAATDYVSQTIDYSDNEFDGLNEFAVPDVSLKSITGATINVDFTYTTVDGETQNWYSDYQNVSYTLYNITKNRAVSQYNVQYPQIVLLEDIEDGDVLRLTATSRTNAFMPVEATATIAEQKAAATFGIVELGQIQSSFATTGNASVVGSLYDASGKLVKTYDYANALLTISNLADGQYTLVSMGSSRLFNTIYDLAQLSQTGLTEGSDYVLNTVEVKSGAVSQINIDEVPTLDESKLYYTGDNTSFTVNKPSIVAGNYLTLTGRIDFKPAYATNVSNVQMIVDMPKSCEFVENSVMVGNSTSSYTLNGNRITIPMARYTDRVRFCIIPTLGGEYAPSAFAQFDIDGETVTQPIGSANYTAKDLSISVPSTVAKTTVPISGTAIGTSNIEIYDNDVLIGQTTSLANGTWATTCELNEPYNLSRHQIYAKVTTKAGMQLQSETVDCMYDMNYIQVSKVHMLYNGNDLVFDFLNPETSNSGYYSFVPSRPEFTFTVDFTDNDTTKISDVIVYAKTSANKWVPLKAFYNDKKQCWVAYGTFNSSNLPVNVSVDFEISSSCVLDNNVISDYLNMFLSDRDGITNLPEVEAQEDEYLSNLSEEELFSLIDETMSGYTIASDIPDLIYDRFSFQLEDGQTVSIEFKTCEGISEEECVDLGFLQIEKTSGHFFYTKKVDNQCIYIDFENDMYLNLSVENLLGARLAPKRINKDFIWKVTEYAADFTGLIDAIDDETKQLRDFLGRMIKQYGQNLEELKIGHQRFKNYWLQLSRRKLNAHFQGLDETGLDLKIDLTLKEISKYEKAIEKVTKIINAAKAVLSKCAQGLSIAVNAKKGYDAMKEWESIFGALEKTDCPGIEKIWDQAESYTSTIFGLYFAGASSDLASLRSWKIKIAGAPLSLLLWNISIWSSNFADWQQVQWTHKIRMQIPTLKCEKPKPDDNDGKKDNGGDHKSNNNDKKFGIDPSGYVYEGVFSNRVEGATATVFYKEVVEDMYGDLHENVVKWNAEEYAQENPLFTDENGFYRWDVPKGLWQVKFEKEGYETTYSEWLPVPPPQLDVNISMKQNRQPEVKAARAYEDAVVVEFDKYMMPELLTAENISVLQNGAAVEGTVELLDEEATTEGSNETFASKVRFNAAQPFTEQEVTLLVSNRVKSYSGIRMQDSYQQTFAIEQEIREIVCDSAMAVVYGESEEVIVEVKPAAAAAGKTLTVASSSPMILTAEQESIVIGDDGKAKLKVNGELPGMAALTFAIDGYDLSATTIVSVGPDVSKKTAMPLSNIASGAIVSVGSEIVLTCKTQGAIIYYTTDGSCPCNEETRQVYDGKPIVINRNTIIRTMAVAPGKEESETGQFEYVVMLGDVSCDMKINGMDIVEMVELVMNKGYMRAADLYPVAGPDGVVNGMDLVQEVELVMSQSASGNAPAVSGTMETLLTLNGKMTGVKTLGIDGNEHFTLAQMTVELSEGMTLTDVTSDKYHTVAYRHIDGNRYAVVCYSKRNATFTSNASAVTFHYTGGGEMEVSNVMLVDTAKKEYRGGDILFGTSTSIRDVSTYGHMFDIYTPDGRMVKRRATSTKGLAKGVYVINEQKVVIK